MANEKNFAAGWTRGLIISLAGVVILYFARSILIPLALSVLLSFVLTPLVERFEKLHVGRVFSITFVTAIVTCGLAIFAWMITRQVIDFNNQLPNYKTNLVQKIKQFQLRGPIDLSQTSDALVEIQEEITGKADGKATDEPDPDFGDPEPATEQSDAGEPVKVDVVSLPPSPLDQLAGWLGPVLYPMATVSIMFLLTIFILLEREDFHGRLVQLFASSNLAIATQAINEASAGITRWLHTMFMINSLYGLAIWFLLFNLGLPNPLIWGVLGFACRFLPYVGPWLAGIFPLLISLAVFEGWTEPLILIGSFVVFELIINLILEPILYGKSIGLSPLGVILAVLFWTWLWGPAGIILAIPLTLWLVVIGRHIPEFNFFAVLFGDLRERPNYHSLYERLLSLNSDAPNKMAQAIQTTPLSEAFEQLLVPLLHRTELDRRAGAISQDQVDYVFDVVDAALDSASIVAEDQTNGPANATASETDPPLDESDPSELPLIEKNLLIIPASTSADEIGAKVLAKATAQLPHIHVTVVSTALVANEIVAKVEETHFNAAVITGLSPFAAAKAHLLTHRLRNSFKQLPILVALWEPSAQLEPDPSLIEDEIPILNRLSTAVAVIKKLFDQQPGSVENHVPCELPA